MPKFSKFIHGVATLFNDQVDTIPYWFDQIKVEIRKPRKSVEDIEKLVTSTDHMIIEVNERKEEEEETRLLIPKKASSEKKIAIPVRIEPKVFFANERTFLSWIHFSIFLGGISTALVGLGDKNAKTSGFLFGIVSILFTLYALYLYRWRAVRIRRRDPGPYDDLIGPTLIAAVYLFAMIANIIFTISVSHDDHA